jgi:hypothetical protein
VQGNGAGDATINYNAGTINTVDHYSYSLNAWAFGSGDAIINYTSGTIRAVPGGMLVARMPVLRAAEMRSSPLRTQI